jgi:hypothetical protein
MIDYYQRNKYKMILIHVHLHEIDYFHQDAKILY